MTDSDWTTTPSEPPQPPAANIRAPAIALLMVSSLAVALGIAGLLGDLVLYTSGAVTSLEEAEPQEVSREATLAFRTIWGIVLVIASTFVMYGSIQMLKLQNHRTAQLATIVAMIPLLGPCCILGIPFGIWAFITLNHPDVRSAFRKT